MLSSHFLKDYDLNVHILLMKSYLVVVVAAVVVEALKIATVELKRGRVIIRPTAAVVVVAATAVLPLAVLPAAVAAAPPPL